MKLEPREGTRLFVRCWGQHNAYEYDIGTGVSYRVRKRDMQRIHRSFQSLHHFTARIGDMAGYDEILPRYLRLPEGL